MWAFTVSAYKQKSKPFGLKQHVLDSTRSHRQEVLSTGAGKSSEGFTWTK